MLKGKSIIGKKQQVEQGIKWGEGVSLWVPQGHAAPPWSCSWPVVVALSGFSWQFCDGFLLCDLEFLPLCVLCVGVSVWCCSAWRTSSGIYCGGGYGQQVPLGLVNLRMFSFCPCIWRVFSPDGEFWVDRCLFLPQHFKDVVPLSSGLHWSLDFSSVMMTCPGVVFSLFILLWFCWTSWICYFYVFHQIWGFWPFFLQMFFSPSLILFSWGSFDIVPGVPKTVHFSFKSLSSDYLASVNSSLINFVFVISLLMISPPSEFSISVIVFFSCRIFVWFYFIISISLPRFPVFSLFNCTLMILKVKLQIWPFSWPQTQISSWESKITREIWLMRSSF